MPLELRHRKLNGVPNHIDVDVEVAVRQSVAHAADRLPLDLWMRYDELGHTFRQAGGRLTDNKQVQDDGLLGLLVLEEIDFPRPSV